MKKLIKLIESKDILKQNYKEILRKYYNIWIENIGIQEDENIIQEDKPVKIITGIEDNNNIEDINTNQNNI